MWSPNNIKFIANQTLFDKTLFSKCPDMCCLGFTPVADPDQQGEYNIPLEDESGGYGGDLPPIPLWGTRQLSAPMGPPAGLAQPPAMPPQCPPSPPSDNDSDFYAPEGLTPAALAALAAPFELTERYIPLLESEQHIQDEQHYANITPQM